MSVYLWEGWMVLRQEKEGESWREAFISYLSGVGDAQRGEDTEEDKSERGVMKINN